jgi:hypothetical protein
MLTRRQIIELKMMGILAREDFYYYWARDFDREDTDLEFEEWLDLSDLEIKNA